MSSTGLGYVDATTAHIPCPTCKSYISCPVSVTFMPARHGEIRSVTRVDDSPLSDHVLFAHGPPDPSDPAP